MSGSSSSSSGSMSSSTCSKTSSSRPLVAKHIQASVALRMHRGSLLTLMILMSKKNGRIVTTKIGSIPSTVLPDLTPTLRNGG